MPKRIKLKQLLKSPVVAVPKTVAYFQVFLYGDDRNIKTANHVDAKIDIWLICEDIEQPDNTYYRSNNKPRMERISRCNIDFDRKLISKDGVVISLTNSDSVVVAASAALDYIFNGDKPENDKKQ